MSRGSNAARKGSSEVGFQPVDKTKLPGKTPPVSLSSVPSVEPVSTDEGHAARLIAVYNSILGDNSGRPVLPAALLERGEAYGITAEHLWLRKVPEETFEEALDMLDEGVRNYEESSTRPGSRDYDPSMSEGMIQDAYELVGYTKSDAYQAMLKVMDNVTWSPSAPDDDDGYAEMMADDLDYAWEMMNDGFASDEER